MKKKMTRCILCCAIAFALAFTSFAAPVANASAATQTITLKTASKTLYVGETFQLESYGTTKAITWKSAKTSVASVSKKGLVTAKKAGSAKITATSDGASYTCTVKVIDTAVDKTSVNILMGGSEVVTTIGTTIKSVKSSAASKAVVSFEGAHCIIKGIGKGSSTVTITCVNGKSYKVKATVVEPYVIATSQQTTDFGNGVKTTTKSTMTYDQYGNIATIKYEKENGTYDLSKYEYYVSGALKSNGEFQYTAADKMTNGTEQTFDEEGRQISNKNYINGFLSSSEEYTYDKDGNVATLKTDVFDDWGILIVTTQCSYEYDKLGRTVKKTTLTGSDTIVNTYAFNEYGFRSKEEEYQNDVLHHTNKYYYIGVEKAEEDSESEYTYDQVFTVKSYANGNVYGPEVTEDLNGRAVRIVDGNKTYEYQYDKSGNMTQAKETSSFTRLYKYKYDKNNNLTKREFYLDGELIVTGQWTYDKNGRLTLEDSDSYLEHFTKKTKYDSKDRVVSTSYVSLDKEDNFELSGSTDYTYDKNDRLTKMVNVDDGETLTTTYKYNTYGLCTSETTVDDEGIQVSKRTYTYDKYGNMTKDVDVVTNSDDGTSVTTTTTQTFDKNGHMLTKKIVTGKVTEAYEYKYTGEVVTSFKHTVTDNKKVTYSETETRDADGNVTAYALDSADAKITRKYNAAGQLLSVDSSVTENGKTVKSTEKYTYDKSGNCLTAKTTVDGKTVSSVTYKYDSMGRITSEKNSESSITYSYDKTSEQIKKMTVVTGKKTETTTYTYKLLSKAK